MAKKNRVKKFDLGLNQDHVYMPQNPNIDSDFKLVLNLIWDIIVFILMFIPNLIIVIFMFLFGNGIGAKARLANMLSAPIRLFQKFFIWLFQAKFTAYIMVLMVFSFILQYLFIVPNQALFESLMTHPNHFSQGNFFSVLTSLFLHADLIHLGTNLLALLIFGRIVEKQFGYKMLYLFLFGGIFSNIVSNLIWAYLGDPAYSLGASGAIASLIIFAVLLDPLVLTTVFILPVPIFLVGWVLIFLDISGVSNASRVNHFAHLSGYLVLLVSYFFIGITYRKRMLLGLIINVGFMIFVFLAMKIMGINFVF